MNLGNYFIEPILNTGEKLMGAWGTDIFENDMSCDLIYDATETEASIFIKRGINAVSDDQEYLDSDEAYEIIVAAAILDAILNGTKYKHHNEQFDAWLAQQNPESVRKFKPDLVQGLQVTLSETSELNELWSENASDYPIWKSTINSLMNKLAD